MPIKISKTLKADTRISTKPVTKEELLKDTKAHIEHVKLGADLICDLFKSQVARHDHTKVEFIDEFYDDFSAAQKGEKEFKDGNWWKIHLEERHHLNARVPGDVNLFDILEALDDNCMAGMARSGEVFEFKLPPEVLERAVQNTIKVLIANIEVDHKE